ncbi:MAG: hypothetical protein WB474_12875 [Nitrososphaeraceae archaeon]
MPNNDTGSAGRCQLWITSRHLAAQTSCPLIPKSRQISQSPVNLTYLKASAGHSIISIARCLAGECHAGKRRDDASRHLGFEPELDFGSGTANASTQDQRLTCVRRIREPGWYR